MRIYILTFNDLNNHGYNCKDARAFTDKVQATEKMREQYLERFKETAQSGADPDAQDSMDYQYTDDYAYIFGEYYWDIFEQEI